MFVDRQQAGKLLAEQVQQYLQEGKDLGSRGIVAIGLPRGGVPVAAEVALALGCPLDILVSKKIGAPDNPELAIGAVTSDGVVVLDQQMARLFGNPERFFQEQSRQKDFLMQETGALEQRYTTQSGIRERPNLSGKTVIVVDDGVATGMTTMAALRSLRKRGVAELILATPVIPYDSFKKLEKECDRLIALSVPYDFVAVGYHYRDFHQVSDEEMIDALKRASTGSVGKGR